jgi:hypothetical protein
MVGLKTLGEVLSAAGRLPLDADLCMPFDEVWGPDTRCAVAPVDRYADEPAVPEVAARNGLERALQVAQVQDIVANARQQLPGARSRSWWRRSCSTTSGMRSSISASAPDQALHLEAGLRLSRC